MEHTLHQERRDFLRKVSLSAGGLLLGFTLFEDLAAQTGKGHVIAAGVEVAFERASVLAVEAPRQLLAVTLKLPLVKPDAN